MVGGHDAYQRAAVDIRVCRDNVDDAHVSDESPVVWPNTARALATGRKFISAPLIPTIIIILFVLQYCNAIELI